MSKFEDQYDDHDAICPYCKDRYQVEAEDFSEDSRTDECPNCGKKYHLCQSFDVNHSTAPDCELNGEVHVYEPFKFADGEVRGWCKICGRIEPYREPVEVKP